MKSTSIRLSLLTWLLCAAVSTAVVAAEVNVPEVKDFAAEGQKAEKQRLPILLMFAADYCAYCERLEEDFLKPMLRSGDYRDKVLIRKLHIDSSASIRDFDGATITPAEMGERYKVSVTPTVVFIDGDGVELAPKRVGLTTPDFYGGYLDDAISQALDILRRSQPMRVRISALN
jgi:thioredoxin-related protein